KPQPGEPTAVDADYAEAYAEQFPKQSFGGKLNLTDSGHLLLNKKIHMAMAGGTYPLGAKDGYRLQWVYLDKNRQLVFTFDCSNDDWPEYADTVGEVLLSLELQK
ncbi:MAG TPA: hypothetical protein VFU47_07810, partial [Armatimonadota bacterium]|nr:hypothetical protein [Armatimonadota bacterium]